MPKAFSDPSQKLKTTEIEKAAGMFCIQYITMLMLSIM